MKTRSFLISARLIVAMAFVFISGCANFVAYSGEPANAYSAATIKGVSPWFAISPIGIVIKAMDGHQVNRFASKVRVSPGQHQLDVVCQLDINGQRFFTRHKLEVKVGAGKLYHLSSRRKGDVCEVFLE